MLTIPEQLMLIALLKQIMDQSGISQSMCSHGGTGVQDDLSVRSKPSPRVTSAFDSLLR